MSAHFYCCEICARNPTCGNDCGSCSLPPFDEIILSPVPLNVVLMRQSLAKHYPDDDPCSDTPKADQREEDERGPGHRR